jgi:hypothetical protein
MLKSKLVRRIKEQNQHLHLVRLGGSQRISPGCLNCWARSSRTQMR